MFPLKIEVDDVELCDICEIDSSIVDVSNNWAESPPATASQLNKTRDEFAARLHLPPGTVRHVGLHMRLASGPSIHRLMR